jgi:ATP-dependent DNA helicase RecG
VDTRLVEEDDREALWGLVRSELDRGGRAFVVYPLVEETDRSELKAVERMAGELARDVFPGHPVGMIHGRLKAADKAAVMEGFRSGEVRVLVATTVVEVGVDVPEASVMVVEHAERFGLAQLHQLRGRVGRGGGKALCLLVVSRGAADESRRRLEALVRTADGFRLAEEDLRTRGPGELAGVRQWGAPDFLLANIIRHRKALEFARKEAEDFLAGRAGDRNGLTRLLLEADTIWSKRARYLSSG